MIGARHDDHVAMSGVRPRQPQGKLVRFAAAGGEEADREWRGELRGQATGIKQDLLVQVACVGVEHRQLLRDRPHDLRVAVADVRHIVVGVEVALSVGVPEPGAESPHDLERFAIGEAQVRSEELTPAGEQRCGGRPRAREEALGNPRDQVRVGTDGEPERALGGPAGADEVAARAEHVEDDLKMQMRRPVAVDRKVPHGGEALPFADDRARDEAGKRLAGEVAVQRVEAERSPVVFHAVLEHDAGAIVERRRVVGEAVDDAVERGEDRRTGGQEDVEAEVHGTPLVALVAAMAIGLAGVDRPRLVVAADRGLGAGGAHAGEERSVQAATSAHSAGDPSSALAALQSE